MFRASAAASADNSVAFPFDVFRDALMQDASWETQRLVHSLLKRQPFHTINESLDLDEWERLGLPATYILSKDDIALPPGDFSWSPRFPERIPGSHVTYTTGGHEAQFTEPEDLAAAFMNAATANGRVTPSSEDQPPPAETNTRPGAFRKPAHNATGQ